MDCYNRNCPFRNNTSPNGTRCDCVACPNRSDSNGWFASNRTLTKEELKDYSRGESMKNYNSCDEYWKGFTDGREYERFIQKQEKESQSEEDISIPGKWISVKFYGNDYVRCSNCGTLFKRNRIFHGNGITYTYICPNCSKQMTY